MFPIDAVKRWEMRSRRAPLEASNVSKHTKIGENLLEW